MKALKTVFTALVCAAAFSLTSCKEEINESARYTFLGHTIASFLESHEEVYSDFIYILQRGGRFSLMKAYGQYTCFAPTNDAIARFLYEQDSIYQTTKDTKNPVWTGITSPVLTELSDSMCKVISQTHLIPAVYLTTDMEGDIIPDMNMNDRYLSLDYDVDEEGLNILLIILNQRKYPFQIALFGIIIKLVFDILSESQFKVGRGVRCVDNGINRVFNDFISHIRISLSEKAQ